MSNGEIRIDIPAVIKYYYASTSSSLYDTSTQTWSHYSPGVGYTPMMGQHYSASLSRPTVVIELEDALNDFLERCSGYPVPVENADNDLEWYISHTANNDEWFLGVVLNVEHVDDFYDTRWGEAFFMVVQNALPGEGEVFDEAALQQSAENLRAMRWPEEMVLAYLSLVRLRAGVASPFTRQPAPEPPAGDDSTAESAAPPPASGEQHATGFGAPVAGAAAPPPSQPPSEDQPMPPPEDKGQPLTPDIQVTPLEPLEEDVTHLEQDVEQMQAEVGNVQGEVDQLEERPERPVEQLQQDIDRLQTDVDGLQREQAQLEDDIERARHEQAALREQRDDLVEMRVTAEQRGDAAAVRQLDEQIATLNEQIEDRDRALYEEYTPEVEQRVKVLEALPKRTDEQQTELDELREERGLTGRIDAVEDDLEQAEEDVEETEEELEEYIAGRA